LSVAVTGRAAETSPEVQIQSLPQGKLLLAPFSSAPFPHPDRAGGYTYHTNFYSAAEHYSDRTVGIFVPNGFRVTNRLDFIVHFHGWRHTVAGTLAEYKLIEQFAASGKNAILIVPQGPLNVPDSFGGKLEDTNGFKIFMAEVVRQLCERGMLLRGDFQIGDIILSGHSGGYHVMAAILDHGGLSDKIKEVWLFDALYEYANIFSNWQQNQNGRLLTIYTDHGGTRQQTEQLMAADRAAGVKYISLEENHCTTKDLLNGKIIFIHSDLVHNEVVSRRDEFRKFVETSGLVSQ
jgi:hypothetical protein